MAKLNERIFESNMKKLKLNEEELELDAEYPEYNPDNLSEVYVEALIDKYFELEQRYHGPISGTDLQRRRNNCYKPWGRTVNNWWINYHGDEVILEADTTDDDFIIIILPKKDFYDTITSVNPNIDLEESLEEDNDIEMDTISIDDIMSNYIKNGYFDNIEDAEKFIKKYKDKQGWYFVLSDGQWEQYSGLDELSGDEILGGYHTYDDAVNIFLNYDLQQDIEVMKDDAELEPGEEYYYEVHLELWYSKEEGEEEGPDDSEVFIAEKYIIDDSTGRNTVYEQFDEELDTNIELDPIEDDFPKECLKYLAVGSFGNSGSEAFKESLIELINCHRYDNNVWSLYAQDPIMDLNGSFGNVEEFEDKFEKYNGYFDFDTAFKLFKEMPHKHVEVIYNPIDWENDEWGDVVVLLKNTSKVSEDLDIDLETSNPFEDVCLNEEQKAKLLNLIEDLPRISKEEPEYWEKIHEEWLLNIWMNDNTPSKLKCDSYKESLRAEDVLHVPTHWATKMSGQNNYLIKRTSKELFFDSLEQIKGDVNASSLSKLLEPRQYAYDYICVSDKFLEEYLNFHPFKTPYERVQFLLDEDLELDTVPENELNWKAGREGYIQQLKQEAAEVNATIEVIGGLYPLRKDCMWGNAFRINLNNTDRWSIYIYDGGEVELYHREDLDDANAHAITTEADLEEAGIFTDEDIKELVGYEDEKPIQISENSSKYIGFCIEDNEEGEDYYSFDIGYEDYDSLDSLPSITKFVTEILPQFLEEKGEDPIPSDNDDASDDEDDLEEE